MAACVCLPVGFMQGRIALFPGSSAQCFLHSVIVPVEPGNEVRWGGRSVGMRLGEKLSLAMSL